VFCGRCGVARLLVTGGAGFIGSNFVVHWNRHRPMDRIVVLDALTYAGNLENLQSVARVPEFRFVQGDICDRSLVDSLLREDNIDTVVHFAAESHVDRSISGPDTFIRTNVVGTHCLLEAARRAWLRSDARARHRFHHISTDEVYGTLAPDAPPFHEQSPYAPNSPYSASKAAADHLVRAYHVTYGLETTISNCSNNYGPGQHPEKLIPLSIRNMLAGIAIPVYGDGRQIRDWLHVSDHCVGIGKILDGGTAGEVYNLGGQCEVRNIDLLRSLCNIVDDRFESQTMTRMRFPDCPAARGLSTTTLIQHVTDRPGHDRRYGIDCGKASRELGFQPMIELRKGLEALVDEHLNGTALQVLAGYQIGVSS